MNNKEKMKVVYLILNGDVYGGAEKHVVDLQNLVSDDAYEKYLIYSKGNKMIDKIDNKFINNCIAVDRNFSDLRHLIKLIKEINPDILHLHAARGIFMGRIIAFICKKVYKMNLKVISTSHGLWLPKDKDNYIYKYLMHFMKSVDEVTIAVSEKSKEELINNGYKREKVHVIYNGVDFKGFDAYRRIKSRIHNVSFVGRFTDQKGIKYLMEALINFKHDFEFFIYGEGELRDYISDFIENNQLNNVKLVGYSNNVGEVFMSTDLLVAPSVDEGLPYTLVEAINCGVPIISTNVGGVPEVVHHKENGMLINPRSSAEIVNAIKEINKTDISQLSQKSIEISEKFSVRRMIDSVEMIYINIQISGGKGNGW